MVNRSEVSLLADFFYERIVLRPLFSTGYMDAGTTYPRLIKLNEEGVFLATCDQGQLIKDRQIWPIFRTDDFGKNWSKILDFKNDYENYPLQMNPVLFEIPEGTNGFKKGTLLLSGILKPNDLSTTLLPIYISYNGGYKWERLTEIDCGGPAVYDNSPESETTAIWEPTFFVNKYGDLTIAYSDERMKSKGILQALILRYFDSKINKWSEIYPIVALPDKCKRPGMISVVKAPNSEYIAVYEVVNSPSTERNYAEVFTCCSKDGLVWNYQNIGDKIKTVDKKTPGSAPYITIIDTNKGKAIVVSSKWMIVNNELRNTQDFFINYNNGVGDWEQFPMPVGYNSRETEVENSGYSQCVIGDKSGIYQLVTVNNEMTQLNDLMFGYSKLPDYSIDASKFIKDNNILLFRTTDVASGIIAELSSDRELIVSPNSHEFVKAISIRYRSVSYPSTLLVTINNKTRLIYLEKTHKIFKWVHIEIGEIINSNIIVSDLQGSFNIEIDSFYFYM